MLDLLIVAIIVGLAGAFIGRTLSKEDIFEGTRSKLENLLYDDCDEEEFHQRKDDEVYKDADLIDGYRLDLPRWQSLSLGKLGDLITCPKCLGVWVTFGLWTWVYVLDDSLNWNWAYSIPMVGVSGAIIYVLHVIFASAE